MPRPGDHLFACISQYLRPLEAVREHLAEHLEWVRRQDAAGRVVATGARVPPTGGVMILAARDERELRELLSTDPFQVHGCAAYHVHEFELNPDPGKGRLMDHYFSDAFDGEKVE